MLPIIMTIKIISIDGSAGEGGGQVLRTSLALSVVTGQAFSISGIRANRKKPGLMRQHLACVKAAAEISGSVVTGAELHSQELSFYPPSACGIAGAYNFAIGSAGSTTLVLQTVLPALLMSKGKSVITIEGGTHNPMAPSYPFLAEVFVPLLRRMGAEIDLEMEKPGFVPAGGGLIRVTVDGNGKLGELALPERGEVMKVAATAVCAGGLSAEIAKRELKVIAKRLTISAENLQHRTIEHSDSAGNFVAITVVSQHVTEMFTAIGEYGKKAEAVANEAVNETRAYLGSNIPVGTHLADQLILPMALGKGGEFLTTAPTLHTRTNIAVVEQFLDVNILAEAAGDNNWMISVRT